MCEERLKLMMIWMQIKTLRSLLRTTPQSLNNYPFLEMKLRDANFMSVAYQIVDPVVVMLLKPL